jgi:hypothetical protein
MIVSANQPYFCPYPGFFYKALLSDVLIILDDVHIPQRTTWVSRNRFKNDQGTLWMTIPVWKKGLGRQHINRVRICHEGRWARKHPESLKSFYANAPYLKDHLDFIEEIFSTSFEKLIDLNMAIIRYLLKCLHIETRLVFLSELGVKTQATQLLVDACKAMGASTFMAQSQAEKYLDAALFRQNGVEPLYFKYVAPVYPQLWGDFIANLSTFDLVFNCGPKARDILIRHQTDAAV